MSQPARCPCCGSRPGERPPECVTVENERLQAVVQNLRADLREAHMHLGAVLPLLTTEQDSRWRETVAKFREEEGSRVLLGVDSSGDQDPPA